MGTLAGSGCRAFAGRSCRGQALRAARSGGGAGRGRAVTKVERLRGDAARAGRERSKRDVGKVVGAERWQGDAAGPPHGYGATLKKAVRSVPKHSPQCHRNGFGFGFPA